ncbi:hypothetical protein JCM10213_005605 [Rhodosporidiobolus nylandii]
MILRHVLENEKPVFSPRQRRPSAQPLLPSLANSITQNRGTRGRWVKVLTVIVGLYWLATLARWAASGKVETALLALRPESCEARGLASLAASAEDERHRVVVRVQPVPAGEPRARNPDNTVLPQSLHPVLAGEYPRLFEGSSSPLPVERSHRQKCITPNTLQLPILPRLEPSEHEPSLFFTACTTPARAVASAPIWQHFMGASESAPAPPCLVTDAQGQGDGKGMASANAAFRKAGLNCLMKDSGRAGERYEVRVLGGVRDAWLESERRRWQDGAPMTEWFAFIDDDTWFTDPQMLRTMLAGYDWREDHFLGSFSETKGNFEAFGKIAYGGAGMILSRSLVRKMQSRIDECSSRFAHIFGGDGLVSHCAALTLGVPLEQVVEEVPALRQMDMKGDASGYLTAGTAPFLTLHHWAGWLDLFPSRDGFSAIRLLSSAVQAVGGPNFLRRWVFDNGAVAVTPGYAITVYRDALTPESLQRTEHTWEGHEPRRPAKPKLEEGKEKLTYYLTSVERLSPDVALLRHTCTSPAVSSGLREIDLLWDVRADQPSWTERLFGGLRATPALPSPRVARAVEAQRARLADELREREDGAFKREKARREVKFEG